MQHPEENPWQINSKKEVYDNPWINLTEYQVINPAGKPGICWVAGGTGKAQAYLRRTPRTLPWMLTLLAWA